MKNTSIKVAWFVFAFIAIGVSMYPLVYIYQAFQEGEFGLRQSKALDLLASSI